MRRFPVLLISSAALLCCRRERPPVAQAAPAAPAAPAPAAEPATTTLSGRLQERIDAPPYSYLRLDTGRGEVWAAVPETKVEKGATVTVYNAMEMDGFESRTLKRKFDVVFFGTLNPPAETAPSAAPAAMPAAAAMQHAAAAKGPSDVPDVKIARATGPQARSVAEAHAERTALEGKTIAVHGKVVKFTAEVMGKNWVHLRDGSGSPDRGDNDLTFTTSDTVKVGDVVLMKGTVRINKDFGAGYTYEVIVEDARVSR